MRTSLAVLFYLGSAPPFFIGTATWTTFLRRSSATIATSSPWLGHTTSRASGRKTSSNASNVFQHLSACASSLLLHSLSQSCIFTATSSSANSTIPFTFTQALATQTERALSDHIRSLAPWERQPGRWALVQGTTRWMTGGATGIGLSWFHSVHFFLHCLLAFTYIIIKLIFLKRDSTPP